MTKVSLIFCCALALTGCMTNIDEFVAPQPHLSPVGSGLISPIYDGASEPLFHPTAAGTEYSVWQDNASNLFRNPRATIMGDVLTVHIQINDRASLDNSTNRSRDAKNTLGMGLDIDFNSTEVSSPFSLEFDADGNIDSGTSTKGKGSIARSEHIRLAVAAVVTQVLANGNLLITGSQEVRVNHEVRVLTIAGIVRPQDIEADNTISYDKIAEARISYGGRGPINEVQRPAWGQRLFDVVTPF